MEIQRSAIVWGKPRDIYEAWLNSETHSRLAGSDTQIAPREGSVFNVGNGEIVGTNRHLEPGSHIVQAMRNAEFPSNHPDSLVDVRFDALDGSGTRVVLTQSEVPDEAQDWFDEHWEGFFARLASHFGVPKESKSAMVTGGEEPGGPFKRALKSKPKRKPARNRPTAQAEKARRAAPPEARPRAGKSSGRTAGKQVARPARGAPAPGKAGGKKTGMRSASVAASRTTVSRPAARKTAKKSAAKKTAPARGRTR